MVKERYYLTRRSLLKLATAPLLAPLVAGCAPQQAEPSSELLTQTAKIEAAQTALAQTQAKLEIAQAVLVAPTPTAPPSPTKIPVPTASPTRVEAAPTPQLTVRPKVVVPELTQEAKKEEKPESAAHVLWTQKTLMYGSIPRNAFFADSKKISFFDINGQLGVYDLPTGKIIWNLNREKVADCVSLEPPGRWGPPRRQLDPVKILFLQCQKNLYAVDAQTGNFKWDLNSAIAKLKLTNATASFGSSYLEAGVVVTISTKTQSQEQSIPMLFDSENGQKILELEANNSYITHTYIPADITVISYLNKKNLDVWNLSTRQFRREVFQEYPQEAKIDRLSFDKTILYAIILPPNTPKGRIVTAFNLVSGNKIWEKTNQEIYGKQLYGSDGFFDLGEPHPQRIYVFHLNQLDNSRQIVALDKKSGNTLWSLNPESFGYYMDFSQEIENTIVFSARKPIGLVGMDGPSGNIIWKLKDVWLDDIVGIYDGVCIGINTSSRDRAGIYGFELRKGNLKWFTKAESRYSDDLKIVLVKDKLIYHNSELTKLRTLDAKSGKIIGEYAVPGGEPALLESRSDFILTYVVQGRHGTLSVIKI